MTKKAAIYKLNGPYAIVVRGRVVDAGRTAHNARQRVIDMGAELTQEVQPWPKDLQVSMLASRPRRRGGSRRKAKTASTSRSASSSPRSGR